jgi:[acyl-carrier-protein] S-malonyltransferase
MLVVVAPGQGAQTPGFLQPWLELPGVAARLHWWSAVTDVDLVTHGTTSDAETIRDTAVAQPLLVAAGLVGVDALASTRSDVLRGVSVLAGHSVGEITAATAADVLGDEQALTLVRERGRAMATASAASPTGMTAVVGGDPEEVSTALARHGLTAANVNGAGQVVAAGAVDALHALAADPPGRVRLRPLSVAGAFHTHHMAPAAEHLRALVDGIAPADPRVRLLSNRDGAVVHHGRDVLTRIVDQVSSPVRWDLCMAALADLGVTGLLELPPAGTLTGLAKRGLPGVATFALSTPDQLADAHAFVAEHADASAGDLHAAPSWRLVVAPIKGTFSVMAHTVGAALDPGALVGRITSLREAWDVVAPHGGRILEWLAEDGDPVNPGQPLLRLHPDASDEESAA